jgi:hypothetical protein
VPTLRVTGESGADLNDSLTEEDLQDLPTGLMST